MRLQPIDKDSAEPRVRAVLDAQASRWGGPLINHLLYARVPAIFHAVRAMFGGIGAAGLIEESLQALVNRRVAALNGCEF